MKELHLYLCSERNCQTNTANKYLRTLRAVINEALRLKLIDENPFGGVRLAEERRVIDFLTSEELNRIRALRLNGEQLQLARDLFVFACFTGLSYSDVNTLMGSEIKTIGSHKMIYKYRRKTNILSRIPLHRPAKEILEKYNGHNNNAHSLLPVPSNQKLNAQLKELAIQCGILKNLTFHMARHTFASTICLGNGVKVESLAKMLGHTKITTTMIYAHVMDDKLIEDTRGIEEEYG